MIQSHPSLKIGQHLIRHPIVQGGMAVRVSGAKLAGAVAKAGGAGVISALGIGLNSPYSDSQTRRSSLFLANQLALIDELKQARSISPTGIISPLQRIAFAGQTERCGDCAQSSRETGAGLA